MIENAILDKVIELINRGKQLSAREGGRDTYASGQGWLAEASNIIELALPSRDAAYRRYFTGIIESGSVTGSKVAACTEVLRGLHSDVKAGLIGTLKNKVRAETFDDFLDHAQHYAKSNRKNEAGVIAGVVFEDTIRQVYRNRMGASDKGKSLETVINTLAGDDAITGQQSKQAKVGAHVRTKATHAQWDEFDMAGVEATIQITRTLLGEHLGG